MSVEIKRPTIYKGWIIRESNNRLSAWNGRLYLNPIYKDWPILKKVIDNIKEF